MPSIRSALAKSAGLFGKTPALVLLSLWLAASALGDAAKPVRVAIIAGEGDRAPKAGIVELLTAELSKQDEMILVERREVQKVLDEQKLTAAGLATGDAVVKLGRLLSADLFAVIERIPQVTFTSARIVCYKIAAGTTSSGPDKRCRCTGY